MGFWSKVSKALNLVETVAPILPIPDKAKQAIAKVGEVEHKAEDVIRRGSTRTA